MKQIFILEKDDIVLQTDWCRPLSIQSMSGGHSDYYSFKNCYSGTPENNVEWVKVSDQFGPRWGNSKVSEFNKHGIKYEFARGDIPRSHRLSMKDYNSMAKYVEADDAFDDDIPF